MAKRRPLKHYMLLLLVPLLFACTQSDSWHSRNISGLMPDLSFHLTDDNGESVTATHYNNKVTLLYFGFTHCKSVCPATMTTLSQALKHLGADRKKVRVLFVSVDPRRDTPAVLHRYVGHFAPQVVGLTGTMDQLHALAKRYRVSFSYGKADENGNYKVSHSSAIFVFDDSNRVRLLMRTQEGASAIADDLEQLVAN